MSWLKKKRALAMIAVSGLLLATLIVKMQPQMEHSPVARAKTPVNVIDIAAQQIRPEISGFGVVEAEILLQVKAEVAGRVIYVHPQLRKGAVLPAGTEVVRIDDKDYQLALKQAEADLVSINANLDEFSFTETDARKSLKLARKKLKLVQQEHRRITSLVEKKLSSQTNLDAQTTRVLQTEQEVQNLHNQVQILPAKKQVLQAQQSIATANVETQRLNLERTHIHLPFHARIDALDVETGQFVGLSNALYTVQDMAAVQVNAQFTLQHFRIIAKTFEQNRSILQAALSQHDTSELFNKLGLTANVTLPDSEDNFIWPASVERISNSLDPDTRTLGVIVKVSNPFEGAQPGIKPPLLSGMYTEVRIQGPKQPFYAVPREALHENSLYLLDDKQQLLIVKLKPSHLQRDMALFSVNEKNNILQGKSLVVSDVFPAVSGMPLAATADTRMQHRMQERLQQAPPIKPQEKIQSQPIEDKAQQDVQQ